MPRHQSFALGRVRLVEVGVRRHRPACFDEALTRMLLTDNLDEHKKDIARWSRLPELAKNIIGGNPCRTDSALDFEIWVFAAPYLMQYIKLKRIMDPKGKTSWLNSWIPILIKRFKDTDPDHPQRKIPAPERPKYFDVSSAIPRHSISSEEVLMHHR